MRESEREEEREQKEEEENRAHGRRQQKKTEQDEGLFRREAALATASPRREAPAEAQSERRVRSGGRNAGALAEFFWEL